MTPDQEEYVRILEAAGKRALEPNATGVFVVVCASDGDMRILWHNENKGVVRMVLIGLLEIALEAMRKQTLENFAKPNEAKQQGEILPKN